MICDAINDDGLRCAQEDGHRSDHSALTEGRWVFWVNTSTPPIKIGADRKPTRTELMEKAHAIVRHDAPATSVIAAERVLPRTGTQRRQVYDALLERPRTDEELAIDLGLPENSIRPRRTELLDDGFIRDSGTTRPTRHGNPAIVWTTEVLHAG